MKQFSYALFDMDGTLVDSMEHWMRAPMEYARKLLPDMTEEVANEIIRTPTYTGMLQVLEKHGVSISVKELMQASEHIMLDYYQNEIDAKPGAEPLLKKLQAEGVKMGLITMTPHRDVDICLARTGLGKYISFVLTPEDTTDGSGKEKTEIFGIALKKLGCEDPCECMFFEDSYYAAKTAREMGFYVVATYDSFAEWDKLISYADEQINLDHGFEC